MRSLWSSGVKIFIGMDSPVAYISRKRKLLKEIGEIASYTLEEFRDDFPFLAQKICSIFFRFDLGESLDEEAASFLEALEEGMDREDDLSPLYERFVRLMCNLHESVSSVRDYTE